MGTRSGLPVPIALADRAEALIDRALGHRADTGSVTFIAGEPGFLFDEIESRLVDIRRADVIAMRVTVYDNEMITAAPVTVGASRRGCSRPQNLSGP